MIPLFWRCEYAKLVGGNTQVAGFGTNGEFNQSICDDLDLKSLKGLMLYSKSDSGVLVPGKATFGGIWTWPAANDHLVSMMGCIQGFLNALELSQLEMHMPPEYFYPDVFQVQHQILRKSSVEVLYTDLSYHIDLKSWSPSDMSKGNRKKLRQCEEIEARTICLEPTSIVEAYALIEANRLSMGVTPSVSLVQMMRMFEEMPDVYELFGTYCGSDLVAAAITVMITDKIRYVYMWADDARYRSLSPVVALCDGIIKYAIDKDNSILDLGTVSEFGIVNDGLARFKTNLGAKSTNKATYLFSSF